MPSCAYHKCTNSSKNKNKSSHSITFHSFPKEELLKHKWVQIVRKQRHEPIWKPTNCSRVCSAHFKPEDMYTTSNGYRKIHKTALPFIQDTDNNCLTRSSSSDSLNNICNAEAIVESERNAILKRKLSIMTIRTRKLIQANKNLKRKNERLIHKCKGFREALFKLKNKIEGQFPEVPIKAEAVHLLSVKKESQ